MRLSAEWIELHSPSMPNKCAGERPEIVVDDGKCECGEKERHTHCPGCGLMISRGPGGTIFEFTLPASAFR